MSQSIAPGCRRVLAVDPGSPDLGAAFFVDGWLERAVWVKTKRPKDGTCPACRLRGPCRHAVDAGLITTLCDEVEQAMGLTAAAAGDAAMPGSVVLEAPVYFNLKLGGGAPINKLTRVVGALADRAAAWGAAAYFYNPPEWKGRAKKTVHQAQALCSFTAEELGRLPRIGRGDDWHYASDAVDAALLGRWWLERSGARPRLAARGNWAELRRRVKD